MRTLVKRPPIEAIVTIDLPSTVLTFSEAQQVRGWKVVILACGHYAKTPARVRAQCLECYEMILNGEDYDAFRNHRDGATNEG